MNNKLPFFLILSLIATFTCASKSYGFIDQNTTVETNNSVDDAAHYRLALAFVNEHREVIEEQILATFDIDLQIDEALVPLIPKVYEVIREKIDWSDVSSVMAFTLMRNFSPTELEELTAFMRTETGKKFMQLSPELLRYYQQTGMIIAFRHSDAIQRAIQVYLDR
jgi:hypothetical protein